MLWLPALDSSSKPAAVPPPTAVSDAAALALEAMLLEPASAAAWLETALLADPWFCRWAIAECPAARTIQQLAIELARDLPTRLASLGSAPPPCWQRPTVQEAKQLGSQAESIHDQALELEFAEASPAESPAYLQAMQTAEPDQLPPLVVSDYLEESPGIDWRLPRLIALVSSRTDCGEQLHEAKLDAMKELAYGASHEINNPLANISGRAQSLLRDEADPKRRKLLLAIDNQAMRAHEMISDLMLFARPPALERAETSLGQLIDQAIAELAPTVTEQQIEINQTIATKVTLAVDPTQLLIAIKALVQNSIDAIGQCGSISIELQVDSDHVLIRVIDTGPGVADEVQQHMFDPFYSGREAGRGLGFGLSKCWRIVGLHGGSVELESTSSAGSTFVLRLPLAAQEQ